MGTAAAAAAKSLQWCPTLCNPIDGSPSVIACQLPSEHLGLGDLGPREGKAPAQAHQQQVKEQSEARNAGGVSPAHRGAAGQRSGEGSQCTHLLQRKALLAAHKSSWTLLILFTGLADWASPYKSSRVIYREALEGLKARLTLVPREGQISAACPLSPTPPTTTFPGRASCSTTPTQ